MKIEKLNENKIRIILNLEDLKEKNIDFHSFMASPIETQSLFLDMLALAEEEVGFVTKNYRVSIEALAASTGDFIFTLTRSPEIVEPALKRKKVHMRRKAIDLTKKIAIYRFDDFDDFIAFCTFLDHTTVNHLNQLAKSIQLYFYSSQYYLVFKQIHSRPENLKAFCSAITEFGSYVHHPELFERRLTEYGHLVMKTNAIRTGIKYFAK